MDSIDNNNNSIDCKLDVIGNDFIEQRVKVDRKKFEQIINGENKEMGSAEEFFKKIIAETNTEINWPTKLKSGAKSKKDPHIRIVGKAEGIAKAKEKILDYLDSRKNRVTLKMDVSFTDHSHIIGKGGRSIQKVMDETGCHIHFPDSNRTNAVEKSNQVSIAGTASGAEQARCRIRELLPLTVYFEIPLNGLKVQLFDTSSPSIQTIQQSFGISINIKITNKANVFSAFRNNPPGFASIAVRSTRAQCLSMKQGIMFLIDHLTSSTLNGSTIPLTLIIDIASQHHSFVLGRGNGNIRTIMQQAGVVITFPDSVVMENSMSSFNGSVTTRKSTVTIKGPCFDSVFYAWQELLGYLPLVLIFDLKEGQELDAALITHLMEDLKVSILIKPKQKQNLNSIMVRGPERDSRNLFEVRRQILDLDESEVPVCCDKHAWLVASKLFSMFLPYYGLNPSFMNMKNNLGSGCLASASNINPGHIFNWSNGDYSNLTLPNFANLTGANNFLQAMLTQQFASFAAQQHHQAQQQVQSQQSNGPSFNDNFFKGFDKPLQFATLTTSPSITSPNSSTSETSTPSPLDISPPPNLTHSSILSSLAISDKLHSSFSWPDSKKIDYEDRKVLALKAFREKPKVSQPRTPTSVWSGFGFSKSLPHETLKSKLNTCKALEKLTPVVESPDEITDVQLNTSFWGLSKSQENNHLKKQQSFDLSSAVSSSISSSSSSVNSLFNSSNFFDSISSNKEVNLNSGYIGSQNNIDLLDVLAQLGFSKYIDNFQQHDIDFNTFLTLNDADLQELGISYFGRRKLLSAIFELKRALKNDHGSLSPLNHFEAAPGAERSRKAKMSV